MIIFFGRLLLKKLVKNEGIFYHTSLRNKKVLAFECQEKRQKSVFRSSKGVVFQHDLEEGFHELFLQTDSVYSEIPWKKGYEIFSKKVGKKIFSYRNFLEQIKDIIEKQKTPTFIISGKIGLKILEPEQIKSIYISEIGVLAYLGIWRYHNLPDFKKSRDLINWVVNNYNNPLDFCCGYGNLARGCFENNKSFVCSDVSLDCISFIAENYL